MSILEQFENRCECYCRQGCGHAKCRTTGRNVLIRRSFVVAGRAAGFTVHQSIGADADVDHRLTEATEFLAFAVSLRLLALCATVFSRSGCGTHTANVAPTRSWQKGDGGNRLRRASHCCPII